MTEPLASVPLSPREEPKKELLVEIYELAKDHWAAQCFGFTGAPESMLRSAHETARDGFDQICKKLVPTVHPILKAEYDAAVKASVPLSPAQEKIMTAAPTVTRFEPCPNPDCDEGTCVVETGGPAGAVTMSCETCDGSGFIPLSPERGRKNKK